MIRNWRSYESDLLSSNEYLAFRHSGELEIERRYPNAIFDWNELALRNMIRSEVSGGWIKYLEQFPFFFLATSNAKGHCDASFRGCESGPCGTLPLIKFRDTKTVLFPDFAGNGLYQSLGNIEQNNHVGMLFVDFEHQRRFRINGSATVQDVDDQVRAVWPMAQAYVEVKIAQAYGNCNQRIPQMKLFVSGDR